MSKRYRVSGLHPVLGHKPGEEFVEKLDPRQEARLIERGSIVPLGAKPKAGEKSGRGEQPKAGDASEGETPSKPTKKKEE